MVNLKLKNLGDFPGIYPFVSHIPQAPWNPNINPIPRLTQIGKKFYPQGRALEISNQKAKGLI